MAIVVPIPSGMPADRILNRAIEIATQGDFPIVGLLVRSLAEQSQHEIDDEIDQLSDLLEKTDLAFRFETRVDGGELAGHLCDVAQEHNAELIIVSLPPKPANASVHLGDQVQKLLVDAPCEVLVVRGADIFTDSGSEEL